MKSALFITVLVLAVAATGVAQKESVEETIRKLDNERIQAQIMLMRRPLIASTLMILSA